jgi:hypothetical protein
MVSLQVTRRSKLVGSASQKATSFTPQQRAGAYEQPRPFFMPLFTNVLEGEFSEVHIHDPA